MKALPLLVLAAALAGPLHADNPIALEFEPRVGAVGARVFVKTPLAAGTQIRFGDKILTLLPEANGAASFIVPSGATTAFIEALRAGKVVGRSAVPVVVYGGTIGSTPKLIGLKEAIDVFGYADPVPEGGGKPEDKAHPVLNLGADGIFTLGEPTPSRFVGPAVQLGDAASAANQGMGQTLFNLTARPPKKKTPTPGD